MILNRNNNKHLTASEAMLLKAWAWEEAHREKDGPAHRLLQQHGIDLGRPLTLLHAGPYLTHRLALGREITERNQRRPGDAGRALMT